MNERETQKGDVSTGAFNMTGQTVLFQTEQAVSGFPDSRPLHSLSPALNTLPSLLSQAGPRHPFDTHPISPPPRKPSLTSQAASGTSSGLPIPTLPYTGTLLPGFQVFSPSPPTQAMEHKLPEGQDEAVSRHFCVSSITQHNAVLKK